MADPLTTDSSQPAPLGGRDRDARVEQLLLQGLDHYFAGHYELAINVWTRVLFLDRGHARARAYIDRARSAQAERQRESDELLHDGVLAFDRGDTDDARRLLTEAAERGAPPELALTYLGRLDRLEKPRLSFDATQLPPIEAVRDAGLAPSTAERRRWSLPNLALAGAGVAVLLGAFWFASAVLELMDLRLARRAGTPPAALLRDDAVPLPRAAELALALARKQFASGHPHDALKTLDRVPASDPLSAEIDRLRADIQRTLLDAAVGRTGPGSGGRLP
jgi:tetratricopeptide (TPR) repeat protein